MTTQLNQLQKLYYREMGLRGSLHDAYRMWWPLIGETAEFRTNWHIDFICSELERVFYSEKEEGIVFNVPPGSSKTSLVSVVYPAWCWLRDPTRRFIVASYDQQLVLRDALRHRDLMQHEVWQQCYRDVCHLLETRQQQAASEFFNNHNGWRFSTSIPLGKVTGRHADIHIYDDPHKPADLTKISLKKVRDWVGITASTRFQDLNKKKRILIMQRLHEDDCTGLLEEQGFTVHRIPMRYEKAWSIPQDPRTVEGELMWPSFKTEEAVVSLEKDLGPMGTAAQLQQRPAPEGGAVFRKEWIKFWYPELPSPNIQMYPDAPRVKLPKHFRRLLQSWDMAFLDEETADWVVGQVWGVAMDGGIYLLDQVRGRWDAPATAREVLKLSRKWPKARLKLIEKKANGPAVISMLKKRCRGLKAIDPDGGKFARASAAAPLFEAGDVYLPSPEDCSWTSGLLYEMFLFPRGKFDDQVDATSQALNYLDRKKLTNKWAEEVLAGRLRL